MLLATLLTRYTTLQPIFFLFLFPTEKWKWVPFSSFYLILPNLLSILHTHLEKNIIFKYIQSNNFLINQIFFSVYAERKYSNSKKYLINLNQYLIKYIKKYCFEIIFFSQCITGNINNATLFHFPDKYQIRNEISLSPVFLLLQSKKKNKITLSIFSPPTVSRRD